MAHTVLLLAAAAGKAVATVGACASVGVYAHKQGLLDSGAQAALDRLIASIFLPCLILGKVAPNVTPAELLVIWPLVAMCVCVVLFGLLAGAVTSRCLAARFPGAFPRYKGLVMVALAFPNSFSVPLTLLLAVGDHPALLEGGAGGGEALHAKVALLFLMSYSVWVLARWSIGYPILSGAISFKSWREKVLNPPVVACLVAVVCGLAWSALPAGVRSGTIVDALQPLTTAVVYSGRCTVPSILLALGARLDQAVQEVREGRSSADDRCLPEGHASKASRGKADAAGSHVQPELVGLSQPRWAPGEDGGCPGHTDHPMPRPEPEGPPLPLPVYPLVLVLRQVVGPAFSALVALGLLRRVCGVTDRVVLMVAMLQGAGPPMINLSVMAGLGGGAERETSKLLLFTYSASVVTWTLSISLFLWLLG